MKVRYRRAAGVVVVEGRVWGPLGERSLLLAIDTGSTYCVVSTRAADALGLAEDDGAPVPIVTASGRIAALRRRTDRFAACGLLREDFTLAVLDLPDGLPFDGLLGLDFFTGKRLCLDFALGELELR